MEVMRASAILQLANSAELTDEEMVTRVLNGETALFEILMRRYNQRLYRVARSILRQDDEAEDVMQDAYVRAYQHLGQFAGRQNFLHGSLALPCMRRWPEPIAANVMTRSRGSAPSRGKP